MKLYLKILIVSVAALSIFIVGIKIGNYNTSNRLNSYFSNLLYLGTATEIKTRIILLELLKRDDEATAQKRLEALVDADLSYLALYVNNLPEFPDKDIVDAIRTVKKYRKKYPEHRINHVIENSVKKTLDFVDND